jgi:hypothetical protein
MRSFSLRRSGVAILALAATGLLTACDTRFIDVRAEFVASDELEVTVTLNVETDAGAPGPESATITVRDDEGYLLRTLERKVTFERVRNESALTFKKFRGSVTLTEELPASATVKVCVTTSWVDANKKIIETCTTADHPDKTTTTTVPGATTTTSSTTQPIVLVIPTTTSTTTTTTTTTSSTTTTVPVGPTTTVPGPPVCLPGDPPPCP